MKVTIEGKTFVSAGGVFVRKRIQAEVSDVRALSEAIAIIIRNSLGDEFSLLRGGVSKLAVATVIFDVFAGVEAIDALKATVTENSIQVLHQQGGLPRPGQGHTGQRPPQGN